MRVRSLPVQLLTISLLSAASWACVTVPRECKVQHSFTVRVTNDYGLVSGLSLEITHFREEEYFKLSEAQQKTARIEEFIDVVDTSVTDAKGEAVFHVGAIGKYYIETNHPAKLLEGCELIVSDGGNPGIVGLVSVKWPDAMVLQTRALAGKISEGLYGKPLHPTKTFHLALHELMSYKLVATTTAGSDGAFNFGDVPTGQYFLQVSGDANQEYAIDGNIPLYIGPKTPRSTLAIMVSETDCGLMYDLEENTAKHKPLACFRGDKQIPCD